MNEKFEHTHHEGAMCAEMVEMLTCPPGGFGMPPMEPEECAHYTCQELAYEFCIPCEVAAQENPMLWCESHGWQQIVDSNSFPGYAGGAVYVNTLTCGCTDLDETADLAAAI
jgi:hypothetical protein